MAINFKEPSNEEIEVILKLFGAEPTNTGALINSSRDSDDIRLNYVINKKYVLRLNTAPVMTEERLEEINRLVDRYGKTGLIAPKFLKSVGGRFVLKHKNYYCYLSEYADYPVAENSPNADYGSLCKEILKAVAKFAQKYKNTDLSATMSMYSIFDLSPYDMPYGTDEKQENLNSLTGALIAAGEEKTATAITACNEETRACLKQIYRGLPRCVFQGDENPNNALVDENGRFIGLIDFNMSGTEVIANYFANIMAYQFSEDDVKTLTAKQILEKFIRIFNEGYETAAHFYDFSEDEKTALNLYGKIVLLSSFPNERFYSFCLNSAEYKQKTLEFLKLLPETRLINF